MLNDFIRVTKAVGDPTRVRILNLLSQNELCVCQLMEILEMGQSTVSKHLGILRNAGLIEAKKMGTWTFYRIINSKANKYNYHIIRTLSLLPKDDVYIQHDETKLKKVATKGIAFCNTIKFNKMRLTKRLTYNIY